jgi:hypothetical protein
MMDPTDARAQLREALQERAELAALKRQLRLQSLGLTIRMWGCRVRLLCLVALRTLIRKRC